MEQDLTGQRFRRLLVLSFHSLKGEKRARARWLCRCDCGNDAVVFGYNLKNGGTSSCGCYNKERSIQTNVTHGGAHSRLYRIYRCMRQRCLDPKAVNYHLYGGRGVTIDARWLGKDGFKNFRDDMGLCPSSKHSVERKDSNGSYSKNNCIWATAAEQNRNKRTNVFVEVDGQRMCLKDACAKAGIGYSTARYRRNNGMSLAQVLSPNDLRSQ